MNKKVWIDNKTGERYDVSHTQPIIFNFEVKLSKNSEKEKVPVKIFFSNHCYSKECYGNDPIHWGLKPNGTKTYAKE